jgi:hypothetical protein
MLRLRIGLKLLARAAGLATRRVLLSIEGATSPNTDDRDSGATVSPSATGPDN